MSLVHLSPAVVSVFLAIVVALVAASLAVAILSRRHPERDFRELRLRVRTWWLIVCLFALAVLLNRAGVLVFFGVVSALALREYLALVPPRASDRRIVLWTYLSIPL